jgi:hypothetical protein
MRVSFDSINFVLRPNKHIERKLVFEALRALDPAFDLRGYLYVGFGSLWFADFVAAHRVLGIRDMVSIQKGAKAKRRCEFNRPYAGINVIEGEAAIVLPRLPLESRPDVLWLDYEDRIETILPEVAELCRRLPSGSVLLVTVNASKEVIAAPTAAEKYEREDAAFRAAVGPLAPTALPEDFYEAKQYPEHLARALLGQCVRQTRLSARDVKFVPLFNFLYSDRAPMITVGGMIVNQNDERKLAALSLPSRFDFVGSGQVSIAAPPLTTREKLALDQLLPSDTPLTEAEIDRLGFSLKPSQISEYHRYYTRYPVFAELVP